jgi:DNA-binding CsgD family transcriptional regulator
MEREGTVTTHGRAPSFIIKRPRLTKLLDDSEARIILLVAPAGYGKTTLAREWLKTWPGPVGWVPASMASADIAELSIGIASELDRVLENHDGSIARRIAALTPLQPRPEALARAIVGCYVDWPNLALAVDDYHHLASSPASEEFVGSLVNLLPITFVLASRTRPNWLEPRLTVYGQAFEIGTNDLAMTDTEAQEVLERGALPRARDSIELAHGWPAIIGLAARTETVDLPRVIPMRLYEFLAADLVGAAPLSVQEALTVLAIADVRDLSTARLLLGEDSASALDAADRRGLLTLAENEHLTLHPLLASFLVERLRSNTEQLRALVEQLVPSLTASRKWNECLALAEAVPSGVFPIESVLERAFDELMSEGRMATVTRWCELARRARIDSPMVDLAESEVALLAGDYEKARGLASRAVRAFGTADFRTRAQLVAARGAHLADDSSEASKSFREAEQSASSDGMRTAAIWGQFLVAFEEESEGLHDALERYIRSGDGTIEHELRCAQGRLLLAIAERNFSDALEASFRGMALLSRPAEALTRLATLNQHAWILASAARFRDALAVSDRALAEADAAGVEFAVSHLQLSKAAALIGLRKFSSAQQITSKLTRKLEEEPNQWAAANLKLANAKLQISIGDLERADAYLDTPNTDCAAQRCESEGYRGLIAAAMGLTREARAWAAKSETTSTHIEGVALPAITRAIIEVHAGRSGRALKHIETAFASGLHETIVMACRAYPNLVGQIFRTPRGDDLGAILTAASDGALARACGVRLPRPAGRSDNLSPRELEVYDLVVQGRTNREISQLLFISESTTKVHVRHILEKLGVRSRVDAVRAWRLDES